MKNLWRNLSQKRKKS